MRKGVWRMGLLALAHLVAYGVTFIFVFGRAMSRMDGGAEPGGAETAAQVLRSVLSFPLLSVAQPDARLFPGLWGYLPIVANSVLWGLALWFALRGGRRKQAGLAKMP